MNKGYRRGIIPQAIAFIMLYENRRESQDLLKIAHGIYKAGVSSNLYAF